jgi:hypothetical protein
MQPMEIGGRSAERYPRCRQWCIRVYNHSKLLSFTVTCILIVIVGYIVAKLVSATSSNISYTPMAKEKTSIDDSIGGADYSKLTHIFTFELNRHGARAPYWETDKAL